MTRPVAMFPELRAGAALLSAPWRTSAVVTPQRFTLNKENAPL